MQQKSGLYLHPLKITTPVDFASRKKLFQILLNIFTKGIAGLKKGCIFAPAKTSSDYKTQDGQAKKKKHKFIEILKLTA